MEGYRKKEEEKGTANKASVPSLSEGTKHFPGKSYVSRKKDFFVFLDNRNVEVN